MNEQARCSRCDAVITRNRDFCDCGEYTAWDARDQATQPREADFVERPAIAMRFVDAPPEALVIEPGTAGAVRVKLRNEGTTVQNLDVVVEGPVSGWWRADPPRVYLNPWTFSKESAEAEVALVFSPPRRHDIAPGPRAIRLVARRAWTDTPAGARPEGEEAASLPTSVAVGSFTAVSAKLAPARDAGRRYGRFEVAIRNDGNQPVTVTMSAADHVDALVFPSSPWHDRLKPGGSAIVALPALIRRRKWVGNPIPRLFDVLVETAGDAAPPVSLPGRMIQRAMLPLAAALAPLSAVLVATAVALASTLTGGTPAADETVPTVTAAPVHTPSASPEPTLTPTASATNTPTHSPTPVPSAIPTATPTTADAGRAPLVPRDDDDTASWQYIDCIADATVDECEVLLDPRDGEQSRTAYGRCRESDTVHRCLKTVAG